MFLAREVAWHTPYREVYFSPYWCLSTDTFFLKARTPTDSAGMSQRSKKETDSHASACERGTLAREPDSPRAPSPAPPSCQDINSHKSEKITMHECKKHDQE